MSYCTLDDLKAEFPIRDLLQLADPAQTGDVDAAIVATAIKRAEEEIDFYLRGRYAVPLAVVPREVRGFACDIAFYYLHDGGIEELTEKRYGAVIKRLEGIAAGKYDLDLPSAASSNGGVMMETQPRVFTRQSLKGFFPWM